MDLSRDFFPSMGYNSNKLVSTWPALYCALTAKRFLGIHILLSKYLTRLQVLRLSIGQKVFRGATPGRKELFYALHPKILSADWVDFLPIRLPQSYGC